MLRDKAMASLRRAIAAFNDMEDDGRETAVLLHLQHAAEMLVKAGLVERRIKIFDKQTGRSIGFERCLILAGQHLDLDADQRGQLRTIDSLRDDEQHWLAELGEELLYAEVRGTVGVLDGLLEKVFGERLADHLPDRALPITTRPLQNFDVLVDAQYSQVADLLTKGRRRRPQARAMIRGLLGMEAHAAEETRVSERDVNRVERGIREGKSVEQVFPRLRAVTTVLGGEGPNVTVRFTKKGGMPVTYTSTDDPNAAAVRELDLQKKFHWPPNELSKKLGLTPPKGTALRRHLGIDQDESCRYVFEFGSQRHVRYSDNAYTRMRAALDEGVDMQAVWQEHGPRRRAKR